MSRSATRGLRTCTGALLVLCALLPGQVLKKGASPHAEIVRIELPPLHSPSLLVVEGRRPKPAKPDSPLPDAELRLNGKTLGKLSDFVIGRDRFRVQLPIDVTPQDRGRRPVFEAVPQPPGLLLGPVKLAKAGVLEVTVKDPLGSGVPSVVEVVSADGAEPPLFGVAPHSPHAGPAWLLGNGSGRIVVPADARLKLLAWTHPFRDPARREVRVGRHGRSAVSFALGADLRPDGAQLLELPHVASLDERSRGLVDKVLGGPVRAKHAEVVAAEMALTVPELLWARLLQDDKLPPVITDRTRVCGLPAGPRSPRSLRLSGGRLLHSNGPVLVPGLLFRNKTTRRVEGELDLRFHKNVVPDRLVLRTADTKLLDLPVDRPQQVPLELKVPSGTRILVTFLGKRFVGDPLAGPKPMAAMILVVP